MNVNKVGSETADGNTMLKLLFITVGSAAKHELYILKFMKSMKSCDEPKKQDKKTRG